MADLYQDPGEREVFVAELLRQGTVVNYELRLKKKDGTAIYGSVNATVHRGPNGEVDWIDGVLEDITERKQAEEALKIQSLVLQNMAEGALLWARIRPSCSPTPLWRHRSATGRAN